jgi:hypothetical protein
MGTNTTTNCSYSSFPHSVTQAYFIVTCVTNIRGNIIHGPCLSQIKLFYLQAECLQLTKYLMREAAEGTFCFMEFQSTMQLRFTRWVDVLQVGTDTGFQNCTSVAEECRAY